MVAIASARVRSDGHDNRVDEIQSQISVSKIELVRSPQIVVGTPIGAEWPVRDVGDERTLGIDPYVAPKQVVHFGQDGPR